MVLVVRSMERVALGLRRGEGARSRESLGRRMEVGSMGLVSRAWVGLGMGAGEVAGSSRENSG
jgi:hypothetical protein